MTRVAPPLPDPFRSLKTTPAPRSLRGQVLAACKSRDAHRRDWVDRIWENPGVRLGWALALVALILAHAVFERSAPVPAPKRPSHLSGAAQAPGTVVLELFGAARAQEGQTLSSAYPLLARRVEEVVP